MSKNRDIGVMARMLIRSNSVSGIERNCVNWYDVRLSEVDSYALVAVFNRNFNRSKVFLIFFCAVAKNITIENQYFS